MEDVRKRLQAVDHPRAGTAEVSVTVYNVRESLP